MKARGLCFVAVVLLTAVAADWPQWRGANRDAKVTGFTPPATWPKELTQKWKVSVGDGVATPALIGDKLYVFARQGDQEVLSCLDAASGKELWQEKYAAQAATGSASGFPGPRSSPTVFEGKVVTLGVRGTLSCCDAASGKLLWRKEDFKGTMPKFFTSCSPIVVNGMCIVQLGGESGGAIVAYDLATGTEKWRWAGDGTAYSSPILDTIDGTPMLIAETAKNIVGLNSDDGKLLWQVPFAVQGRGYNAATPIADGSTILFSGTSRGTKAVKIEKQADGFAAKDLWTNSENSVQYNTPVLKNGLIFGLSANDTLFCINAQTGKTAWTSPTKGRRGYGSIVDAGAVLMALTPAAQLIIYEPTDKEFKQIASYKVADGDTYAYPIVAGKRIFVKDRTNLIMYTLE